MRTLLIAAVSGLLLTTVAEAAPTPASPVGPRPSYNLQRPGEDIGPFAGGAKTHRAPAGRSKPHRPSRPH